MADLFLQKDFDELQLQCSGCGWSGKGEEAHIVDLYGLSKAKEVHCPRCDTFLGNLEREDPPAGQSADPLSFQIG